MARDSFSVDFSDLIEERQRLFKSLWITWESARVKAWLKRVGCRNEYELSFKQYASLLRSLRMVERDLRATENRVLVDQVDGLLEEMGLNRKHPLIEDWLRARGVLDGGMTPDSLKQLHGLLTAIWEQKFSVQEIGRQPQQEEYRRAA